MNIETAIVVGASYGGMCASLALRCAGIHVDVYERHPVPDRIGGGIVVQPEFADYLAAHGFASPDTVGVPTVRRRFLARDGSVAQETPDGTFYTAWDALLRSLRGAHGEQGLHCGVAVEGFEHDDRGISVRLSGGGSQRADLLIAADGVGSSIRKARLVPEAEVPKPVHDLFQDSFVLFAYPRSHLLGYFIPGPEGARSPPHRRLNWVWYVSLTEEERDRVLTDRRGVLHRSSLAPGEMSEGNAVELVARARAELPSGAHDARRASRASRSYRPSMTCWCDACGSAKSS